METKKKKPQGIPVVLTALKILEILKESSDQDHPIPQTKIAAVLGVDRKTVDRCISIMEGYMDYEIERTRKGVYLIPNEDAFELSEIRILIDSVLSSKVISEEQTDIIVKKLARHLNKHDRTHIRHIHSYKDWSKVDNINIFWTIEVLDDAINKKQQVAFDYNTMGIDKKLHVTSKCTISPVQLTFANGQYFVLGMISDDSELHSYRIDRITNVKLLGVRSKLISNESEQYDIASTYVEGHPYMSFGNVEFIKLRIQKEEIGRVFDVFGTKVRITECYSDDKKYENMVEVTFKANTEDVYRFMVQNADVAEIFEPHAIRARILRFGRQMHIRYLSSQEDWDQANYSSAISDKWQLRRSSWLLEASDRGVRRLIEQNGTADKVWGLLVDAYDEEIKKEVKEYVNLRILEFGGKIPAELDLSMVGNFTELQRVTIEQRNRKEPTVNLKNLSSLNKCKRITQIHFFNVEINEDIDFSGIEKLTMLNLRHCRVADLAFVKKISTLMRLEVSGDFVDDISGIYGHKRLRVLTVDNEFMRKFDIDALRKQNPKLRIEVHSQRIDTDEDINVNHSIKDID